METKQKQTVDSNFFGDVSGSWAIRFGGASTTEHTVKLVLDSGRSRSRSRTESTGSVNSVNKKSKKLNKHPGNSYSFCNSSDGEGEGEGEDEGEGEGEGEGNDNDNDVEICGSVVGSRISFTIVNKCKKPAPAPLMLVEGRLDIRSQAFEGFGYAAGVEEGAVRVAGMKICGEGGGGASISSMNNLKLTSGLIGYAISQIVVAGVEENQKVLLVHPSTDKWLHDPIFSNGLRVKSQDVVKKVNDLNGYGSEYEFKGEEVGVPPSSLVEFTLTGEESNINSSFGVMLGGAVFKQAVCAAAATFTNNNNTALNRSLRMVESICREVMTNSKTNNKNNSESVKRGSRSVIEAAELLGKIIPNGEDEDEARTAFYVAAAADDGHGLVKGLEGILLRDNVDGMNRLAAAFLIVDGLNCSGCAAFKENLLAEWAGLVGGVGVNTSKVLIVMFEELGLGLGLGLGNEGADLKLLRGKLANSRTSFDVEKVLGKKNEKKEEKAMLYPIMEMVQMQVSERSGRALCDRKCDRRDC